MKVGDNVWFVDWKYGVRPVMAIVAVAAPGIVTVRQPSLGLLHSFEPCKVYYTEREAWDEIIEHLEEELADVKARRKSLKH